MKKKICYGILVLFMAILLVGCGKEEESGKTPSGVEKSSSSSSEKLNTKAQIQEKVIVDRDNVKITAKSIEYDGFGVDIKLLIENNSSQNITVQTRDFSINGIMLDPSLSADVAPGKKANDSITLYESELKNTKITTIKDMEFSLNIFNADTYDDIFVEKGIKLETDAKNYTQEYNTDGKLIVDQNNIKIYALKLDDKESFWGADLMLYIENNSDKNITVQARDVSINGFMIDPSFSADVNAGKKAYDSITFFESDLKDNNITDITELELKLVAYDSDDWLNDVFETENLKINFE